MKFTNINKSIKYLKIDNNKHDSIVFIITVINSEKVPKLNFNNTARTAASVDSAGTAAFVDSAGTADTAGRTAWAVHNFAFVVHIQLVAAVHNWDIG